MDRRLKACLAAAALAALLLLVTGLRQDPDSFGYFHDDTLYFSAAKALAEGRGLILPSVPGSPALTKYPPLYPWLLAGAWRLSPQFPENVSAALWLSAAFAAALAAGWFYLLQDLGAGPLEAWVLAAMGAFHPFMQWLSGAVLSDVPFLALAVWTALAAGRGWWAAATAGAVAAVLMRSMGVAVVAGVAAAFLYARQWRRAAAFGGLGGAAIAAGFWWQAARLVPIEGLAGYRQTMIFYTSYTGFWRLSVPDAKALGSMLALNLEEILKSPAAVGLPLASLGWSGVVWALAAGMWYGAARLGRQRGWPAIHWILLFYSGLTLGWNYPLANRFLAGFLPLFLLGGWREAGRLARALRPKRLALAALAVAGVPLLLDASYSYLVALPAQQAAGGAQRRELALEKAEVWRWIREQAGREDRFVAYEDALLWLHTGRQALRPLAFPSQAYYRDTPETLAPDLQKLTDTARQIRARFWVHSADDYQLEPGAEAIERRTSELLRHFPVVFRSSGGRVRVHEVRAQ